MKRGRNLELVAGTSAHYEDPTYYDSAYADRTEDIDHYRAVVRGRSVLELGCGTGRITIPLADDGAEIVAVDRSVPMLRALRQKLRARPVALSRHVQVRRGDMRRIRLGQTFRFVLCPFNTFLHLYSRQDVEAFLATVRAHLPPRGELLFDVSVPDPEELGRGPDRPFRLENVDVPGVGSVRYAERFDYEPLEQVLHIGMEFSPVPPRRGEPWVTPLSHRQFFPRELEALLHYNGFRVAELIGDFDGPASADSMTLVYRCRLRPGWSGRQG